MRMSNEQFTKHWQAEMAKAEAEARAATTKAAARKANKRMKECQTAMRMQPMRCNQQ